MASLKNPFAIKDEEIIVISDLTLEDRGLKYDYPQPISTSLKPQPLSEDEGYSQVKDLFTMDDEREHIKDSSGRRWIKCKVCAEIKPCYHFAEYGGANAVMGLCSKCSRQNYK